MGIFDSPRWGPDRAHRQRVVMLGVSLALGILSPPSPAAALGSFTRHIGITVGGGVVGGPHANFPVLVQVIDGDLLTTANGGKVTSASGYDIVFRGEDDSICGGVGTSPCMLDHEIEEYNGSAGVLIAWVRVPSLAAGRVLHLYYGNSNIASSTEATGAVFDADYVGVWHLNQTDNGPWNHTRDSSRYGNHGTGGAGEAPAMTTRTNGKIGFAQHFSNADGTYDFIDAGDDGTLNITGNQITLEAWIFHNIAPNTPHGCSNPPYTSNCPAVPSVTNPYGIINHKGYNDGYRLFLQGDPFQCPNPNGGAGGLTSPCLGFGVPGFSDTLYSSQYGSPATDPVTGGVWHHVAATYDNVEMKLYLDGQKLLSAGTNGNHLVKDGQCLSSVDCATVGVGGTTVTFNQALPAAVAAGHVLTFDARQGGPVENFLIAAKPDATHVTIAPAAYNHSVIAQGSYTITSPFKTGNIPPSQAEQGVWIGAGDQPQNVGWSSEWEGDLDEVRVSRVARSASWIQTEYNNQNNPATFAPAGASGPAAVSLPTLTTVYRSIGTNAAVLYATGTASAGLGGAVVTFAGGASLPPNVGPGDRLDFTGSAPETLFVLSHDSATQVTLQTPAASGHTNETYTVRRAYNTLQAWENALPANLVAANVREVGVAFYDAVFTAGVTFSGSVTDPARNIVLTAHPTDRQRGIPNEPWGTTTTVRLDNLGNATPAISIQDDYVTVEYLEIAAGAAPGAHGVEIASVNPANLVTLRNNLIHSTGGDGIRISDADTMADVYNNFIYGANSAGIRILTDLTAAARVNVFNNTVYASVGGTSSGITSRTAGGARVRQTRPRVTLRNNIFHSNTSEDQDVARPFDAAYFCTGITGNDPNTCSAYVGHVSQPGLDNQLTFTNATRCLYLGSNEVFRGVAVHLAVNGTGSPDMQWDYWSGAAWSSLETGSFEDYNFQYDGFAYWPDDPSGWATRLIDVDGTPRYWVRVCRASGAFGTLPTESIISRADVSVASRYNLTTDYTGYYASEWRGVGVTGLRDAGGTGVLFNSATNLHIQAGSIARDAILNQPRADGNPVGSALNQRFVNDVDLQGRPFGSCPSSGTSCWDIGADEYVATTAVSIASFEARPSDGAVDLAWQTGAEVDNLGFRVYRSLSGNGPWTRLTPSLIPGQGFSAMGASYTWRDSGLQNGVLYYFRLEDVDTKSVSTFHGPVSAVPQAAVTPAPPEGGGSGSGSGSGSGGSSPSCPPWALAQLGSSAAYTCEAHGDAVATSFRVLSRTSRSVLVELETEGFLTARDATGHVRTLLPGFDSFSDPLAPALPLKRTRLDGVVGRQARIGSVQARDNRFFSGLVAAAVGYPQAVVAPDGTVNPGRREAQLGLSRGAFPRVQARLAGEGFQGEDKTLALELMPLRYEASRGALVLSRKLTVRVDFVGVEPSEVGRGRLGRHVPRPRPDSTAYAFLATSQKGLHSVAFEVLFPGRPRPLDLASLRLTRDSGRVLVPYFVLPQGPTFGPGSRLFFNVDATASSTSFAPEVVYALERGTGGVSMSLVPAPPDGSAAVSSRGFASFETNRIYAPDVLGIEDLWQWESLGSGVSKTKPFSLDGLDASSPETARLVVYLQGGSDAESVLDHHVQVFVNGALVAEESFDGAVPRRVEAEVPATLLVSANELTVTNVGDTGVASRVFLDRFEVLYPQVTAARSGAFDGAFSAAGTADVAGISSPAALLDVTAGASWLTGYEAGASLRFRAETGHRYLAVSPEALLSPRVFFPEPAARLRSAQNQADYVLVAPRAFLAAAEPLLERRQAQGLSTFAVSLEEIASSFGGGQASAEAIRDFLSFAYHQWQRPSPRYVLLLGDSNYDPRHFNPVSQPSPMPFLLQRTTYIWTASDPALADLNGDDALPDLAIGRLPATTVEQAQSMVGKILDWEAQGQSLDGNAAMVADNPDTAGDFEADARDIETSFLTGRDTTEIFLGQIGNRDTARAHILDAFDQGLSLISYVGHGGGAVWAGENILNSSDPAALLAQPRQPFMLTMDCLNGYFIAPFYESLAEGFLKAQGKGTIAAFSPSGLSLEGPAHLYHRALMQEITSGGHERLGDAVLAAQKAYAQSGAFPELLALYHLLGDPAMRIR